METVIGVSLIFLVIAAGIWAFIKIVKRENKGLKILKEQYEQALQSGDRKAALDAGRKYFTALRNGNLSIYDEQRLTNDLSTMK